MLRIKAFKGLRPASEFAPEVASVPYDVVDVDEAATLARGNPRSLLHVDRAEIDLPAGTDPYSKEVYERASESFMELQAHGTLLRENEPCVYLYKQRMGQHMQTGLAAVCHIEDYENDIIKKHEKTRKEKEDDRTLLIDKLSADTGPVFLTYRDAPGIDDLVTSIQKREPLYDFIAVDGIQHTVWRIPGGEKFIGEFGKLQVAYVADGHHRTASAVRVGRQRREANPNHTGAEEYNWFLAVLFPASQLQILPYNRCIRDLNGLDKNEFMNLVRKHFMISENANPSPDERRKISMYIDSRWFELTWDEGEGNPISKLDVSVLQDRILAPILGIHDPRTSHRIDFIGGIRGTTELSNRVDSGEAAVAFSMHPTTVEQLMEIADEDQIMPPKSTWFEPKLRSGLFIHTFDQP